MVHSTDSDSDPLAALAHQIASARQQLFDEPLGLEPHVDDPLERLTRRVASGVRAASFAPPLTGIVADIEAAAHIRDHAYLLPAVDEPLYDVLEVLSPSAPAEPVEPPRAVMLTPALRREAPAVTAGKPPSSRGGVIAEVLLDAIATRPLSGEARAEAARLLSEGLALGDEALMHEALATLITGV